MADSAVKILLKSLTQEEYDSLPGLIRSKIESCINEHVESYITSRAVLETTRASSDDLIESLKEQVRNLEKEREEVQYDLSSLKDELSEAQLNIEAIKNDNEKLQATIKNLETDCVEYRRQRDLAVDERDEAMKMVERRNNELQRLQEDIATLTNQLQAAVQAKCEALAKADEVESLKLALDFKEKRLDQERGLLNQQIQSLSEDLTKQMTDMTNMRREHTNTLVTLRTQLSEKTEELKILSSQNGQLTETNAALNHRVEVLTQKLLGQCDSENTMTENYQQEIKAQTKLADLYKGLSEEASAKNEELTNAVRELQGLLNDATQQYGDLETKLQEKEVALEVTLEKKNLCIQELKKELEHANELIEATKQQSIEKAVESLSPAAAATSRLLKSGLTLTQLYMQYAQASEQLMLEKEDNKRLTNSIDTILRELELKAPILKKQREDYDYAMTTVESLTSKIDEMEVESSRLRATNLEAEKTATHLKRENKRLQDNLNDLGRQVCFLLKEVEESRGNTIEMTSQSPARRGGTGDLTTSAEVIAKHLVTFKDIQEMQVMNQKLLSVVRELSEKQEQAEREKGSQLVEQLESKLRLAEQRITGLQETETHYIKAMEVIKGQREMYRTLFQQQVAGLPLSKIDELEKSVSQQQQNGNCGSIPHTPESRQRSAPTTPSTPGQVVKIEMLEQKFKDKTQELKQLQDDFNTYKKEKTVNERMLNESLEKAREELRSLAVSKSGVVAKAEYTEEKFKALKANADAYKAQIQALEKKNNNYSVTIAKHEQSITHLKDECIAANSQLSRAEVMLENLKRDYQLVKESEARLLRERETTDRQSSSQAMLMANLEMIKASFERTETETKLKLETKLEEAQKECSALRRRLQEDQDRFRERTDALERTTQAARTRLDEEKEITHQLRTQLDDLRSELREAKENIQKLIAKVRTTAHKVMPDPETEKRALQLETQLAEKVGEIACLTEQLKAAKLHAQELSDISQSSEKQLLEVTASHLKCKEELEAKVKSMTAKEVEMRKVILELESKVSSISSVQKVGPSVDSQLSSATEELATLRAEVAALRDDLATARAACQVAEEKYSHEMMLHADDMQAMSSVKKQLSEVSTLTQDLVAERDAAKEALRLGEDSWAGREKSYSEQLTEMTQRLTDMDKQNNLLHDQLQELGLKVAVVSAQQGNMSTANLDTSVDDDTRNSDQLLQVLKYIRREKNISITQADALRAETLRLKAQVELQTRQLLEAKEMLDQERNKSQESLLTSAKHEELLRKVDTLNALTDSNRLLREERDKLALQVTSLEQQLVRVETEIVAGYKEKVATQTSNIDQLSTENTAIKAEAARWRARANALIEKQNKNSPEDFRRLTLEKENLTKQVNSVNEELKVLKMEKSKLEEQLNTIRRENQQQRDQVNDLQRNLAQLQSELTESKAEAEKKSEELAKMTQDFTAQEATLNDIKSKELQIRQIAKKYKVQYQELSSKNSEEEKKKKEVVAVISTEEQERLREEGRQQQTERVRQLTEQVGTMQTEATNLRKDIELLRSISTDKEERAKVLLKNARARIMLLTDEKRKLTTENTELKSKADSFDKNKDDTDVRQRKFDKEKADLIAEKERLARELDMATTRANLLQRQLDKLQGTVKPSTSSGVEKSSVEPPTANIKPMAGPSSSVTKQQPTQHSVTVTPWRGGGGETPFASIRPMSMQSRTVAVLPTTNQSSQAVLVSPQQQMVHTSTGTVEGLSSSPTSSHTDYMPATSSGVVVNLRQATVPPTQQPPPSAESTQDMEVEGSQAGIQAGAAANPQALSIALVLPQPTAQTSTQTTQTSAQDAAVVSASTQQEQTTEQNVVSASNHVPNDQGLVSASSNQPSMCSTAPAYYRQDVDEAGPSTEQQSVVASSGSESQLAEASNSAEQCATAAGVASSYANSSNTVTTSQAGVGSKRLRDTSNPPEEDANKSIPPAKRGRLTPSATVTEGGGGEMLLRSDGLEVEYQVPTSSQRDQEDDVILVDSDQDEDDDSLPDDGGLDDGQEFEEEVDTEENYELGEVYRDDQEMASYDVGEGPDIDENITNQDNNEVEVNDDSNEVPNQSESSSSAVVTAVVGGVEGRAGDVGGEATSSGQGRVSSNQTQHYTRRTSATHIPPLNRQHQLLLPGGYEEVGDDSIVPSTPTLFVPRRTDGFGEAVSSPHVPSGRFTFSDNNPPTTRAGVAQVASEGMDDTRMDLSQLEDSSTGRSVPSTPLQVSPQGEVGQSSSADDQTETNNNLHIPTISISQPQEMPPPSEVEEARVEEGREPEEQDNEGAEALDEPQMDPEESGDGVSSEGEKSTAVVEEVEEGREAEATETPIVSVVRGAGGTARRSARAGTVRRRATTRTAPTRIVWNEDPPSSAGQGNTSTITIGTARGGRTITIPTRSLVDVSARGNFRGRNRRARPFQYSPRF